MFLTLAQILLILFDIMNELFIDMSWLFGFMSIFAVAEGVVERYQKH